MMEYRLKERHEITHADRRAIYEYAIRRSREIVERANRGDAARGDVMPGKQKHTIWPEPLFARIQAFVKAQRKLTGERYCDDDGIRDLTEIGLRVVERHNRRRKS
jgi:hypothetical protein